MTYFADVDWSSPNDAPGALNYPIFEDGTAPCRGCNASVNRYDTEVYPMPGIHEDNEGFYVVKGSGAAKVGEEERKIQAGTFFYAPAGVPHSIKKDSGSPVLEVVLFHFPVTM